MSEEIFDVVNEKDEVIGQRPRVEVHRLGLRHRAVHVLVFNRCGELFLQKRSMTKDCFPGAWDSSASGHLDVSETYDACALREVREELGLELRDVPERLFKLAASPETGQEFVWVYRCNAEGPFRLHPEEIERGEWCATERLEEWLRTRPEEFASAFRLVWAEYRQRSHGKADAPFGATAFRPLRIWPALSLVLMMLILRYGPTLIEGGESTYWIATVFGPLLVSLLLMIWWLAASRATWKERLLGFVGMVVAVVATSWLADASMRGPGTTYLTIPMGMAAFAVSAAINSRKPPRVRTGVALALALVACSYSLLLRNEGMTGDYSLGLQWRWTTNAEERMLAHRDAGPLVPIEASDLPEVDQAFATPDWPGFRGADRAGRQLGPPISTDWDRDPPEQLWKVPVGPGWSSFAVAGSYLFTQEQRGPMETVVCYHADSGGEVWVQQIEARFDDPLGGPGPRATPSLANQGLFVTGATGWVLRLEPKTGEIVWKQELQIVAGRKPPMWGFAASPLVVDTVVIVHAGGADDRGVVAFDVETGELRWSAAAGEHSYSSPQLSTIAGEQLVLMLSNDGLRMLEPKTGQERLNYEWAFGNYRALQPHVVGDDIVLLPTGMNTGTRAIRVSRNDALLTAEELWTSRNLKPDFSDFVTYEGNLYGFDGGIFASVELESGGRNWKGGRYGKGQVLLLEDSGLLLVATEKGDVVVLEATPEEHAELASFKALDGKTWNHPVVVGDRLYLRNSQEAACYRLPLAQPNVQAPSRAAADGG